MKRKYFIISSLVLLLSLSLSLISLRNKLLLKHADDNTDLTTLLQHTDNRFGPKSNGFKEIACYLSSPSPTGLAVAIKNQKPSIKQQTFNDNVQSNTDNDGKSNNTSNRAIEKPTSLLKQSITIT